MAYSTRSKTDLLLKILENTRRQIKISISLFTKDDTVTAFNHITRIVSSDIQNVSVAENLPIFLQTFGTHVGKAKLDNPKLGDEFYKIFPYLNKVENLYLRSPFNSEIMNRRLGDFDNTHEQDLPHDIETSGAINNDCKYEIHASAKTVVLDYSTQIFKSSPMYLTNLKKLKSLNIKFCDKVGATLMASISDTVEYLYFEEANFSHEDITWPSQLKQLSIKSPKSFMGKDWMPDFCQLSHLEKMNLLEFESMHFVSDFLSPAPNTVTTFSISLIEIDMSPYKHITQTENDKVKQETETNDFDVLNLTRFTNTLSPSLRCSHFNEQNLVKLNLLPPSLITLQYDFIYDPTPPHIGTSFIKFQFSHGANTSVFPISIKGINYLSLEVFDLTKVRNI
ncbi:unnamed protein product [Ambrosiozyma monospora]|uniref:Unnamed protein product n=1 Tax=Ambrosiozyma monospora TaxID=43982 RepID=A0ACB5SSG2_AMBMO|nr:unnamed protein product [Ambrosiozyma monospora]